MQRRFRLQPDEETQGEDWPAPGQIANLRLALQAGMPLRKAPVGRHAFAKGAGRQACQRLWLDEK